MANLLLIFVATFVGLLLATLTPYFRKLNEGKIEKFDWKYFYHLIGTTIWTFTVNIVVYIEWLPPDGLFESEVLLYLIAFIFGYGGNEAQKQLEKIVLALKER